MARDYVPRVTSDWCLEYDFRASLRFRHPERRETTFIRIASARTDEILVEGSRRSRYTTRELIEPVEPVEPFSQTSKG